MEPWHNINKLEQVIGRGIRNCSHNILEEKKRNITIYLHTCLLEDKESIETTHFSVVDEKGNADVGAFLNAYTLILQDRKKN